MSLQQAEHTQIMDWLNSHMAVLNCDGCLEISWEISDVIWGVTPDNLSYTVSPEADPMIQLVCTHCGFIRLFSAKILGIPEGSSPG